MTQPVAVYCCAQPQDIVGGDSIGLASKLAALYSVCSSKSQLNDDEDDYQPATDRHAGRDLRQRAGQRDGFHVQIGED